MNELKELEVDEVSLVDAGANPQAHILFFKRKEDKSMAKQETAAEVVEKQEQEVLKIEEPMVDVEKSALQARVAELEKALADRDAADKAAVEKEAADKAAATSAELAAALERVNKRMEAEIEKREDKELMDVAKKYEIIGEKAEDTFKLLKSLKGTDGYQMLIDSYDRVAAQFEKAGTFKEVGKVGGDTLATLEKLAKKYQAEDPTLSWPWAMDKAYQARPDLQD